MGRKGAERRSAPEVQTILSPSGEEMVVLPRAAYDDLLARSGADGRESSGQTEDAGREEREDAVDHERALADYRVGRAEALTSEEVRDLLAAPTPLSFWRRKRGLTQQDRAAKADIPQGYLSQLESGRKRGSPETLKRIAQVIGVDLDSLVD